MLEEDNNAPKAKLELEAGVNPAEVKTFLAVLTAVVAEFIAEVTELTAEVTAETALPIRLAILNS
jgi:hypothetical protein